MNKIGHGSHKRRKEADTTIRSKWKKNQSEINILFPNQSF